MGKDWEEDREKKVLERFWLRGSPGAEIWRLMAPKVDYGAELSQGPMDQVQGI